jgi:hypothetical protein
MPLPPHIQIGVPGPSKAESHSQGHTTSDKAVQKKLRLISLT